MRHVLIPGLVLLLLVPVQVRAQGLLVDARPDQGFRLPRPIIEPPVRPVPVPRPQPAQAYKIKELAVQANLADQIARVQVSQTFVNTGSRPLEVRFVFPLPYDGAVDGLTFMVDGQEHEGRLLDAQEARRIYEGYVRRNEDPALMEWIGTGMFQTSVFPVPPGGERTVSLRYNQVCRQADGMTEWLFPLSTAKYTSHPVERLSLQLSIQSRAAIQNVYSPTHAAEVRRPGNLQAVVSWQSGEEVPSSDFRVLYDVGDRAVGASVLSYRPDADDDGYFLLLLNPDVPQDGQLPPGKNVIFVVDRSGSMSGPKMQQAKDALKFVLNNLHEGDLFNIIVYDGRVESFRPQLQRYEDSTRDLALGYVEGIYAGGSTNIDGALQAALGQLTDTSRPSYVVFLTDGLPTVGERRESQIVSNARQANQVRARVFSLGVGYDVNSRLLDKLARAGFGQTQYVRPDEDIEEHVSRLYRRIGAPALTDVALELQVEGHDRPEQGSPVNRVYPRDIYDLFAGDQLVVVGRYKQPGAATLTLRGAVQGDTQNYNFPARLANHSPDETYAFIEKLWAMRRVGQILDQIDLEGKNPELVDELIALSSRHGILTPYTAFLAEEDAVADLAANRRQAGGALRALEIAEGQAGFAQRAFKGDLQGARQAPAAGPIRYRRAEQDREVVVQTVKTVGRKTFFLRQGRWVDSTLTPQQQQHAQPIQRYSQAYFDLAARYGKDAGQYLALEGEVIVVLDGQAYAF